MSNWTNGEHAMALKAERERVQQLRDIYATHPIVMEAAARIERLEALLQTSESLKRGYFDEIERLQAALAGKDLRHKKSPPAEADGR